MNVYVCGFQVVVVVVSVSVCVSVCVCVCESLSMCRRRCMENVGIVWAV